MVEIASSLAASMGTSAKDLFMVSNQVPPGGITAAEDILGAFNQTLREQQSTALVVWEKKKKNTVKQSEIRGCRQLLST